MKNTNPMLLIDFYKAVHSDIQGTVKKEWQ